MTSSLEKDHHHQGRRYYYQHQLEEGNSTNNLLLDRKIDDATSGLSPAASRLLHTVSIENALSIVDYILSMKTEINLSDHYRDDLIRLLTTFSKYNKNNKSFRKITRNDVITFLESFRRSEAADSLHQWIGTYNNFRMHLVRFFKWLYYPDIEPDKRPKPQVIENIPKLKRKEQSIYKPSDMWTTEDDLLFLKYCPNKRDKCYHTISRDLSCRPHEILKLKIKDIFFKFTPSNNYQYAEVLVNGKTGTRPLPLIDSIPYLKDYLDHEHPQPSNPNAPLICGISKSLGRHISTRALSKIYRSYKKHLFPKLLELPNVLPEDRQKIRELLKKPWYPYIRRHSALTEKSTILKEHVLRQHAGWSIGSQMPQKYLHYFGNESSESLLEAYGIMPKGQKIDQLKPKQCPNCSEPNKPDSKFCAKCRMVLTYDAYNETVVEKQQEKDKQIEVLIKKQEQFEQLIQSLIDSEQLKPTINNNT